MSAVVEEVPVAAQTQVRRSDRGAMAGGGTVSYEVYVGDRWIGWVGDERAWLGHRHGGRRWWACWREEDDTVARWNSAGLAGDGYRTRDAAVQALLAAAGLGGAS